MKHTMLKCLSLVLALATLVSVCSLPALAATPCNHYEYVDEWTYIGEQEPTCTEYGGKVYLCPHCGEQFADSRDWENGDYKPLGHDWVEVGRKEPTLTEDGWVDYDCSRCDATKREPRSATKCVNCTDLEVVDTATCTEAGTKTTTCKTCGYVETVASPAKGHTWDKGEIVKAPICGASDTNPENYGIIKFTCTVCDDGEYIDDKVAPESTSHRWEWIDEAPTACGVAGCKAGYKCHYCDADYPVAAEDYEYLPAPEHQLVPKTDDEHQNTPLGCVDEVIWGECSVCGEWVDMSDRTATGAGTLNGNPWQGNHYIVVDATNSWVVTDYNSATMVEISPATCTSPAYWKCNVEGCTHVTAVGTKKPHNFVHETAPTCQTYGFVTCQDCGATSGYVDLEGNILNPDFNKIPHSNIKYDVDGVTPLIRNPITTVAPGCTKAGYDEFLCWMCNETVKVNPVPALGHIKNETLAQAPTCTEPGWDYGWSCERGVDCDKTSDWDPSITLNALGHDWQYRTSLPANCMYGIHDGYICDDCGIEKIDYIPTMDNGEKDTTKHIHDENSLVLETQPTCTKPGLKRWYCQLCFTLTENVDAPTHHSFELTDEDGNVIGIDPTAHIGVVPAHHNKGYKVYFCTNDNCDIEYGDGKEFAAGTTLVTATKTYTFVHENYVDLTLREKDVFVSHYETINYVVTPNEANGVVTFDFDLDFTGCAHDSDGKTGAPVGGVINNGMGSCGVASHLEFTCTKCAYRYNKQLEDNYGLTGQHVPVSVPDNPGTCTTAGYTDRVVCNRCQIILDPGNPINAAHTFDVNNTTYPYRENVRPTCTEYGYAKIGFCTVCNAEAYEGRVDPTGHTAGMLTPAQPVNCYQPGWNAHYNCINGTCDAVLNNAALVDPNGVALEGEALVAAKKDQANWVSGITAQVGGANINGYQAQRQHIMQYVDMDLYGCPVVEKVEFNDGYKWYECAQDGCDHVEVLANYYYGFYNHRYTNTVDFNAAVCKDSCLYCENQVQVEKLVQGVPTVVIEDCHDKKILNDVDETTSHVSTTGVIKGIGDCSEYDPAQDHLCTTCNINYTRDYIHITLGVGNYSHSYNPAHCKQYAHDAYACVDCGHTWVLNVVPGYGNHIMNVVDHKDASYIAGGYTNYECAVCGETDKVTTNAIPGVKFDLSVSNKHAGHKIFDGSIIAITVSTSAFNVGVTGITLKMSYNNNIFTYVGFHAHNTFGDDLPVSFDAMNATSSYNPNALNTAYGVNGVVTMTSVAEHSVNGILQNETLNGKQTYMTLYFRVDNAASSSTEDMGFEIVYSDVDGVFDVVVDPVLGTTEKMTDDVTHVIGDSVDLTGEIKMIADINGDGYIALEDVEAMRLLVLKDAAYTAPVAGAADINKDGKVDILDYALLMKKINNMVDYWVLANELVGSALA